MILIIKRMYLLYFFTVPSLIPNVAVQPLLEDDGSLSLVVTWDKPQSDATVTSYEGNYRIQNDTLWQQPFSNNSSQFKFVNVTKGRNLEVRVRAMSILGHGEYAIGYALRMCRSYAC